MGTCEGKPLLNYNGTNYFFEMKRPILLWSEIICKGDIPSPRSHHASCLVDYRYMYIIGGRNGVIKYNDVYVLDFLYLSFKKIEITGTKLPCIYGTIFFISILFQLFPILFFFFIYFYLFYFYFF